MSAAEKLKTLDIAIGGIPIGSSEEVLLCNALPQIVAVVEAAERNVGADPPQWPEIELGAALAALDEALGAVT